MHAHHCRCLCLSRSFHTNWTSCVFIIEQKNTEININIDMAIRKILNSLLFFWCWTFLLSEKRRNYPIDVDVARTTDFSILRREWYSRFDCAVLGTYAIIRIANINTDSNMCGVLRIGVLMYVCYGRTYIRTLYANRRHRFVAIERLSFISCTNLLEREYHVGSFTLRADKHIVLGQ